MFKQGDKVRPNPAKQHSGGIAQEGWARWLQADREYTVASYDSVRDTVRIVDLTYANGRAVGWGIAAEFFVPATSTPGIPVLPTDPKELAQVLWREVARSKDSITMECKERDPSGISLNTPGAKADAGKLRPTLIFKSMSRALEAVIKIATDGAAKYTVDGWLAVPNGQERYEDAQLRHMLTRFKGQPVDAQSQSLHLAHEAWNALAKLELYLREQEGQPQQMGLPL